MIGAQYYMCISPQSCKLSGTQVISCSLEQTPCNMSNTYKSASQCYGKSTIYIMTEYQWLTVVTH